MPEPGNVPATGLAARLRAETRELHGLAERSGVMGRLLTGQLDAAGYVALLRNLHAIYEALEAGMARHANAPGLSRLAIRALRREPALAADLVARHGPAWREDLALQPTAHEYVSRLQAHASKQPVMLAAHAYVRYLGDLNGGQALRRLVAAIAGPAGKGAQAFLDFGTPEEAAALQCQFRDALASLLLDERDSEALAQEARWAFEAHVKLFEEIELARRDGRPQAG